MEANFGWHGCAVQSVIANTMSLPSATEWVIATKSASRLLKRMQEEHGPVILYQAKGCYGAVDLMCFPLREFLPSSREVKVAEISGASFYVRQVDLDTLIHHQLVVDAGPGSGGLFSMERILGVRFFTRVRKKRRPRYSAVHPSELKSE